MTKREHEAMQAEINKIETYRTEASRIFKELQNLNATEGTGNRWCCAETNAIDLLKCGKDYMHLLNKYNIANAKADMLTGLGRTLADLGFWK